MFQSMKFEAYSRHWDVEQENMALGLGETSSDDMLNTWEEKKLTC